jgi:hypothetical protein
LATLTPLDTPVAFILFNRPDKTAQSFARIREVRPAQLFLIADGPRPDHPTDADNCNAARAIVERIDWPCTVERNFAESNLGCKHRVSSGLDWVFEQVDAAIIIEDDIVPDLAFFRFAQELLNRYQNDTRIMHISGRNDLGCLDQDPYSYFFSRLTHIWGWATWRRAWRTYNVEAMGWTPETRALVNSDWAGRTTLPAIFDRVHRGEIDTWDYQWLLNVILQSGLSIIPTHNLVSNIGFGAGATHTTNSNHRLAKLPTQTMRFPLTHPPYVYINPIYETDLLSDLRQPTRLERIRARIKRTTAVFLPAAWR